MSFFFFFFFFKFLMVFSKGSFCLFLFGLLVFVILYFFEVIFPELLISFVCLA